METKNNQKLLVFSCFTLSLFISVHAICVPRKSEAGTPSQPSQTPPPMQPVSFPQAQPSKTTPSAPTTDPPQPKTTTTKNTDSAPETEDQKSHGSPPPTTPEQPPVEPTPFTPQFPLLGMLKGNPSDGLSANVDPLVKKVCASTDYSSLCESSIAPLLSGAKDATADAVAMLELVIKAASEHTKLAIAEAEKLIAAPTTPAKVLAMIKDCKDNYDDALDNYQSALDAIPARDIGTINSMLSAALTDYTTCDDGFEGLKSPVAAIDRLLSKMASNTLAVASLVN
ncbi:21 kDa protein-like [Tripterygium wilfordii]|uniref:21 kDa protein-like n=1 Tax=Tripterygium wilfordii TaxID=458696 RepID=A0A7J7CSI8_TRIWF|nr:proteoglycan 4-like [Tripterygium wilfordii]KAF5737053.1 21 kDa protein-like [Tripterygium wilfordii]